jgi:penicillin V acylase-like amidase (Ntn superfamily)
MWAAGLALGFGAVLGSIPAATACTSFVLPGKGGPVVGKSYDWHMGQGLVLMNKRGVSKRALAFAPGARPATWISRHASVTFNQYGRELPNGGMNDAGLVVEVLWLDTSRYEDPDARPTVNELQWIQLQLDSFSTVKEMVQAAPQTRIAPVYAKVHYFACDRTGACAAFESIEGKQVVSTGAKALTNHPYAVSAAFAAKAKANPGGPGSLDRFVRASRAASAGDGDPVAAAFRVLDDVRGPTSQWNIVYEPATLAVHFRSRTSPAIKRLDFSKVDSSCAKEPTVVDIDAAQGGDVTARLEPYRLETNRRLIAKSARHVGSVLPPGAVDLVARYPSGLACSAP